jgi:lipopolysaccharide/colanic/teichoic acid biosynthesis glycosyltransferase
MNMKDVEAVRRHFAQLEAEHIARVQRNAKQVRRMKLILLATVALVLFAPFIAKLLAAE